MARMTLFRTESTARRAGARIKSALPAVDIYVEREITLDQSGWSVYVELPPINRIRHTTRIGSAGEADRYIAKHQEGAQ